MRALRDGIDAKIQFANGVMNELLRDRFEALGVKFEQATWDAKNKDLGKPTKRRIEIADIAAQTPFHWGYVFDDIVQRRGGFDIILANPPWEVFQTDEKEFFQQYDQTIQKNKLRIENWAKQFDSLMAVREIRDAWLAYVSRFPHMAKWYKKSPSYQHQTSIKINLYLLFVERAFDLLRPGGECGIVIPSGIYTDLGAKGLRDLLFEHTQIQGLFCFENRKAIFEGVDSRFKFVVLTFEKSVAQRLLAAGEANASAPPNDLLAHVAIATGGTQRFPAAFMRQDVAELDRFPAQGALWLDVPLIKRLSPGSHSVMEFKSELDIEIAEKMLRHPFLGERIEGTWNFHLSQEFNMTTDSKLFKTAPGPGRLPLYEGKMIHQFESARAPTRYWVDSDKGRSAILGKGAVDSGQELPYQRYRFAHRAIARNTDSRTLIATVLPANCFFGHSMNADKTGASEQAQLLSCALLNSFCFDYFLRQMVTANLTMFFLYQSPVPREPLQATSSLRLIDRAARLICTAPAFDDLAKSAGLGSHKDGATDAAERAQLRAEIDGLVAHLYGLTESEFTHIVSTFPLVQDAVKVDAHNAYRRVASGLIQ